MHALDADAGACMRPCRTRMHPRYGAWMNMHAGVCMRVIQVYIK